MTQEEKSLILRDLCSRLPYGIECCCDNGDRTLTIDYILGDKVHIREYPQPSYSIEQVQPYLRPMPSMTKEEREACADFIYEQSDESCWIDESGSLNLYGGNEFIDGYTFSCYLDWLNSHHFDYRGLIERGLALEAPKDMYKD